MTVNQPPLTGLPLDGDFAGARVVSGRTSKGGLLPRQRIEAMIEQKMIWAQTEIDPSQLQPASLDLRLGSRAFRIPASFLPGREGTVEAKLAALGADEMALGDGAVLEQGCVYLVEIQEHLRLPDNIDAAANPKSSTGRLDVFTRLISDRGDAFDTVRAGYQGALYAEISPRSFAIKVRRGSKLNQIRFRYLTSSQMGRGIRVVPDAELTKRHEARPLVDGQLTVRGGLVLRVALSETSLADGIVGYRAKKQTRIVDVDRPGAYERLDYWEPIPARGDRRLILDPHQFYILASAERLHIPRDWAAEMVPIDPTMGEFRVHYAGFFDPGFGHTEAGHPGSRAVLEVRSHEVPFVLEDGQIIGRLVFERLSEAPDAFYGQMATSNYQGQSLKLSKHFR